MALGARISSTNLSGKTATVTFTPYTGTTSGTTQNLGTQTIPFNNITSHPYGDYAIYLEEYDYTYTLTVSQPNEPNQLFVYVDQISGDYNFGAATFNFNDLTASIIDLNVRVDSWYINNINPIDGLGFGYQFYGVNDGNDILVIFTDSTNTEIDRYSGNTNNYNFNALNGKWVTYEDRNNGVLKYFNGVDVYTYTYDSSRYSLDIQWDYDSTTADSSFIFIKYDEGQGDNHNAYIVKTDGTVTLLKTWSSNTDAFDYSFYIQYNNDFFVVEEYNFMSGEKSKLQIYDTDGTVLETVSLTGTTYINRNYGFHGTNKFYYIAYDSSEVNTAYKIVHYNFDTTTLIETSHDRGTAYESFNDYGQAYYADPNDRNIESLALVFFDNTNNWDNWSYEVNYYDVMYMFGDDSEFTTFTYTNNQSARILNDWQMSDVLRTRITTGDTACILTISGSTSHIENLGIPVSGITNVNSWFIDNKTVYSILVDGLRDARLVLIGEDGTLEDQESFTFTADYGYYNTNTTGGKTFYGSYITTTGDTGYYVNDAMTGFTQISYYDNINDTWRFANLGQRDETTMVLFSEGSLNCRVLDANGISSEFTLPSWYGYYNFLVGVDKFLYVYNDSDSNFHAKLYDFSGNTINTLDTTETNINGVYGGKDRYIVVFNNGDLGRRKLYMITPTSIESLILQDNIGYTAPNDIILWD